jgi:hypothetical protein
MVHMIPVAQRPLATLVVAALLGGLGCTTEFALPRELGQVRPKLVLHPGSFQVVRTVTGRASAPALLYFDPPPGIKAALGIPASQPAVSFGLGDMALRVRALRDLHQQHDLVGRPQVLHNFVEEWTVANYLGLFAIIRVTMTAEVLEFTEEP